MPLSPMDAKVNSYSKGLAEKASDLDSRFFIPLTFSVSQTQKGTLPSKKVVIAPS